MEMTNLARNQNNDHLMTSNEQSRDGWKLIVLRKYTLAICFLETLAIVLLLSYLFLPKLPTPPSHHQANTSGCNQYQSFAIDNEIVSILVGPISPKCNQRQHDLNFSVICHSNSAFGNCERWGSTSDYFTASNPESELRYFRQKVSPREVTEIRTMKDYFSFDTFNTILWSDMCSQYEECKYGTRLLISPDQKRQKIIGWGGALTDSSINNILSLTTNGSIRLLDDYFGENGLKFNLIRLTIGGSDYSSRFYTNDDLAKSKSESDFELNKFNLTEDDLLYKIPMIKNLRARYNSGKSAQKEEPIKLIASMWSPPVWMKTNHHFNKGQLKGSFGGDERYFSTLAKLKRKFLLAYANHSVDFWGLTVMNEPLFAVQPFLNFNTMIFPQQDYARYVAKYLGPTIKNDLKLNHIKLIAHDDNRRYLYNFTLPILQMESVSQYIDGVATHGYIDNDYHQMKSLYAMETQKRGAKSDFFILPTELCSGHLPFMEKALIGNWQRGMHYALDIIHSLQNSAAGWVDWNMVLDTNGGPSWLGGGLDSPVIVDKSKDLYHKNPMYFALGHFSRHIPPGSVMLESQLVNDIYDNPFEQVTFELPDRKTIATVFVNHNPYPIYVYLSFKDGNQVEDRFWCYGVLSETIATILYSRENLQRS